MPTRSCITCPSFFAFSLFSLPWAQLVLFFLLLEYARTASTVGAWLLPFPLLATVFPRSLHFLLLPIIWVLPKWLSLWGSFPIESSSPYIRNPTTIPLYHFIFIIAHIITYNHLVLLILLYFPHQNVRSTEAGTLSVLFPIISPVPSIVPGT